MKKFLATIVEPYSFVFSLYFAYMEQMQAATFLILLAIWSSIVLKEKGE